MKATEQGTKKLTKKEKLQIIAESKKNGVKVTLAKHSKKVVFNTRISTIKKIWN